MSSLEDALRASLDRLTNEIRSATGTSPSTGELVCDPRLPGFTLVGWARRSLKSVLRLLGEGKPEEAKAVADELYQNLIRAQLKYLQGMPELFSSAIKKMRHEIDDDLIEQVERKLEGFEEFIQKDGQKFESLENAGEQIAALNRHIKLMRVEMGGRRRRRREEEEERQREESRRQQAEFEAKREREREELRQKSVVLGREFAEQLGGIIG